MSLRPATVNPSFYGGVSYTDLLMMIERDITVDFAGIYVGAEAPTNPPSTFVWVQTGLGTDGNDMTVWVEDGT